MPYVNRGFTSLSKKLEQGQQEAQTTLNPSPSDCNSHVRLPVAGRLRYFREAWSSLTTDNMILDYINGVKIQFLSNPPSNMLQNEIFCSLEESNAIDLEIQKFLSCNIINEAIHCSDEYVSQIFPRSKKNGGTRIILNLKTLNEYVTYEHFTMENLNTVIGLIENNCFMASIDLENADYSVNIHPKFRKFLRFTWKSKCMNLLVFKWPLFCNSNFHKNFETIIFKVSQFTI